MHLRLYQSSDLPSLFEICLRTGDAGRDASGRFADSQLVGRYYAVPYAVYAPELCLILADPRGPCGYVLGALDTADYAAWFNRWWLPGLQALVRDVRPPRGAPDAWLYRLIRRPLPVPPWADPYPAHLHIDLLPRAQGRGWGRRMIETWTSLAAARGATGVHLGVAPENRAAIAFYRRLGLTRLPTRDGSVVLAKKLR